MYVQSLFYVHIQFFSFQCNGHVSCFQRPLFPLRKSCRCWYRLSTVVVESEKNSIYMWEQMVLRVLGCGKFVWLQEGGWGERKGGGGNPPPRHDGWEELATEQVGGVSALEEKPRRWRPTILSFFNLGSLASTFHWRCFFSFHFQPITANEF